MVILVMSDSHSGLRFMRRCVETIRPTDVVHLGDLFDDGKAVEEENPHIRFHLVPGNCDYFSRQTGQPQVLRYAVGGVRLFMTHGHLYDVKFGYEKIISRAYADGADIILFGHTHVPLCQYVPVGTDLGFLGKTDRPLLLFNPGSIGQGLEHSFGLLTFNNGDVLPSHGKIK